MIVSTLTDGCIYVLSTKGYIHIFLIMFLQEHKNKDTADTSRA
jgi:hypothetical protein